MWRHELFSRERLEKIVTYSLGRMPDYNVINSSFSLTCWIDGWSTTCWFLFLSGISMRLPHRMCLSEINLNFKKTMKIAYIWHIRTISYRIRKPRYTLNFSLFASGFPIEDIHTFEKNHNIISWIIWLNTKPVAKGLTLNGHVEKRPLIRPSK